MTHAEKQMVKEIVKKTLESMHTPTQEDIYRYCSHASPVEIAENIINSIDLQTTGREG